MAAISWGSPEVVVRPKSGEGRDGRVAVVGGRMAISIYFICRPTRALVKNMNLVCIKGIMRI